MIDDVELIRLYARDLSEPAFRTLVERHLDFVYSTALRRLNGDAHAAADVSQQVFAALARQSAALAAGVVLPGWLYATTRNLAVNYLHSEQRRRTLEQEAQAMHELHSGAPTDWDKVRPMLEEVIDELGERDREAILLRYFVRRPFAEIGAALNLSEDGARMRVERALDKLHGLLARRGVTSVRIALATILTEQAVSAAPSHLASTVAAEVFAGKSIGTTFQLLELMKTTKIAGVAGGLLLLVGAGTAIQQAADRRSAEAELATTTQSLQAQLTTQKAAEREAATLAQANLGLRQQVQEAERARAASASALRPASAPAAAPAAQADLVATGEAFLAAHLAVREAFVARSRARVAGRYLSFYDRLQLTPAQITEFENLMMMTEGMRSSGPDAPPMVFSMAPDGMPSDREERIKAVLGDAGYQALQEYNRSGLSMDAHKLASSLYFTPTPLTASQATEVARIIRENRPPPAQGQPYATTNWDAALAQAEAVLAEPQLAILRGFAAQEQFNITLNLAMGRHLTPTQRATPAGPAAK